MDAETLLNVAIIRGGEECGRRWLPGDPERWRAECIDDGPDDGPGDVLRFWCPGCWEREFEAYF